MAIAYKTTLANIRNFAKCLFALTSLVFLTLIITAVTAVVDALKPQPQPSMVIDKCVDSIFVLQKMPSS